MADTLREISDLPPATSLTAGLGDFLIIKQGDTDRKIRVTDFLSFHIEDFTNPHQTTKTHVGLDQINNWPDEEDPTYASNDRYANIAAVKAVYDLVQSLQNNLLPTGTILIWSGSVASIPSGFQICDGTNGTPNLRNRFVVGAGDTYGVGSTGGSINTSHNHTATVNGTTLTWQQIPPHSHATGWGEAFLSRVPYGFVSATGKTNYGAFESDQDNYDYLSSKRIYNDGSTFQDAAQAHSHSSNVASTSLDNRPPYYALCYIMKL